MAAYTRQPFAELGTPRLHALHSAKNRQNAMSLPTFASPLKPAPTPSIGKRQRAPDLFDDDDADSENIDPANSSSPSKKTKTSDAGAFAKPSRFALTTPPPAKSITKPSSAKSLTKPSSARSLANPSSAKSLTATPVSSIRKALSSPITPRSTPITHTPKSTPINHTRGSPKHNRVGALAKRRASTSPFRRIDPPSFSKSPALPFSIDAALSGTINNHSSKAPTPAPVPAPTPAPTQHVSTLDDSMPKSWFFAIHEDTPEQEAANLMEHSASVLDISTDDDIEDKKLNEERGKENIPPLDLLATPSRVSAHQDVTQESALQSRSRKVAQDAMDEDRRPLGDLAPEDFYGQGCDKDTYVTVDVGIEKPSSLSKECAFTEEEEESSERDVADPASVAVQPEPTLAEGKASVQDEGVDALAPVSPPRDVASSAPLQDSCSEEL